MLEVFKILLYFEEIPSASFPSLVLPSLQAQGAFTLQAIGEPGFSLPAPTGLYSSSSTAVAVSCASHQLLYVCSIPAPGAAFMLHMELPGRKACPSQFSKQFKKICCPSWVLVLINKIRKKTTSVHSVQFKLVSLYPTYLLATLLVTNRNEMYVCAVSDSRISLNF